MVGKGKETIIPPGVDALPNCSVSSKRRSFVPKKPKDGRGALESTLLEKFSNSKQIHKPSPTRRVLMAADGNDGSDVRRLSETLKENRKKAPIVFQSDEHCSSADVQKLGPSMEHIGGEEKCHNSYNTLSSPRKCDSDSDGFSKLVPSGESTLDERGVNSSGVYDVSLSSIKEDQHTRKNVVMQGLSEHSTQYNSDQNSADGLNESKTGSVGSNSNDGSLQHGNSDIHEEEIIVVSSGIESSDDSSVEVLHEVDAHPSTIETSQSVNSTHNTSRETSIMDKRHLSINSHDGQHSSWHDLKEVTDPRTVKKLKRDTCVGSTSSDSLFSNSSSTLDILLSQARSNNAMELNLNELIGDGNEMYCKLSDIHSNARPAPNPPSLKDSDWCFGRRNHLKVPWSPLNLEKSKVSQPGAVRNWVRIRNALTALVADGLSVITDFKVAVQNYKPLMNVDGLLDYFDGLSTRDQENMLSVLSATAGLVLKGPQLFTKGIRFLTEAGCTVKSATFSREQCACLLANSFFCTFPENNSNQMNELNMTSLLSNKYTAQMKMKFFLTYFESVTKSMPSGCVTFNRRTMAKSEFPHWKKLDLLLTSVETSEAAIEDLDGCLQVDFANKFIGGGVLSDGAVQEEIRFLICPEMIVSLFICSKMSDHEAIHIYGAKRFSSYTGYGSSLEWKKFSRTDPEKRDIFGRTSCELVAIDAFQFGRNSNDQYKEEYLLRELNKAYVGFASKCHEPRPIATGNWGCGVFEGDKEFKSLIQIIVASAVCRNIIYVPYGDNVFGRKLRKVVAKLRERQITVGMLYNTLIRYRPNSVNAVFDFVMTETAPFAE